MNEIDDKQEKLVSEWMKKFAAQSAPLRDLPSPGILLFKARLIEEQSAATRALRPLDWMRMTALIVFAITMIWLVSSGGSPLSPLFKETISSLMSIIVLFCFGAIAATVICLGFAYLLRDRNGVK